MSCTSQLTGSKPFEATGPSGFILSTRRWKRIDKGITNYLAYTVVVLPNKMYDKKNYFSTNKSETQIENNNLQSFYESILKQKDMIKTC